MDPYRGSSGQAWNGEGLLICLVVFPLLASIAIAMRMYTRFFITKNPAVDDLCLTAALLLSYGFSVLLGFELYFGSGHPRDDLSERDVASLFGILYLSQFFYITPITLVKVSILLLYLRICRLDKIPRRVCYGSISVMAAYFVQNTVTAILICQPVERLWKMSVGGKCLNKTALWFYQAAFNVFSDFFLLLLPLLFLRHLTMPLCQRLTVLAVFSLGGFACICSLLRINAVRTVTFSKDTTWDSPTGGMWSCIELNVGIACASISTLKPLVVKLTPGLQSTIEQKKQSRPRPLNRASHVLGNSQIPYLVAVPGSSSSDAPLMVPPMLVLSDKNVIKMEEPVRNDTVVHV